MTHVNLELFDPADMEAFASFLTTAASNKRKRDVEAAKDGYGLGGLLGGIARTPSDTWRNAAETQGISEAAKAAAASTEVKADPEPEKPARTSRAKKADKTGDEVVKNLDPKLVKDAAENGVKVQGETVKGENVVAEAEKPEVEETKPADEGGTELTENDVRNMILDHLADMQKAHPDDPDIRTKTLKPLLDALGAVKISLIPMTEYGKVAGLIEQSKKGEL